MFVLSALVKFIVARITHSHGFLGRRDHLGVTAAVVAENVTTVPAVMLKHKRLDDNKNYTTYFDTPQPRVPNTSAVATVCC